MTAADVYRVSWLDSFRRWEHDEDATVDDLLRDLADTEGNDRMRIGTAFHKALELVPEHVSEVDEVRAMGCVFRFGRLPEGTSVRLPIVRELRGCERWTVDGRAVVVTGQADGIDGRTVVDLKTTLDTVDAAKIEGWAAGYQWRLYLRIFGADVFRWQGVELREVTPRDATAHSFGVWDDDNGRAYDATEAEQVSDDGDRIFDVVGVHAVEQRRYPGLNADCDALVHRFTRFAREHMGGLRFAQGRPCAPSVVRAEERESEA